MRKVKTHTLSKPHIHAQPRSLCRLPNLPAATSVRGAAACCYYPHDSQAIKAAKCVFPDSSCRRNVLSREIAFPVRCEAAMALISHMCGHSGWECGRCLLPRIASLFVSCFRSGAQPFKAGDESHWPISNSGRNVSEASTGPSSADCHHSFMVTV